MTGAALLLVEGLARRARTGGDDDRVLFVDGALFEARGDRWSTTEYAEQSQVPASFARPKGDRWRAFVVGASFAMGTPYVVRGLGWEPPGGIASWLGEAWRRGGHDVEVINAAAGAQTSHRVRRIVDEVVQLEPDLLVVLTGNNEGVPNPAALREAAQRFASYRLLRSLVRPAIADPERPAWTPQLLPPEALREQLRANLEAIAAATGRLGVPVLLATLPIHLRYVGGGAPPGPGWVPPDPNVDACTAGAKERQEAGDPRGALEAVEACEQSPSALLWAGLALADLGRHDEAKQALEASVELLPRNRCRPSLNAVTRQVAAAHGHAHAVDLEALFAASAPGGLPGSEVFLDYCHLQWTGYARAAEALRVAADEAGVGPGPAPAIPTWQGAQARAWGLPEDPSVWPDPQPR